MNLRQFFQRYRNQVDDLEVYHKNELFDYHSYYFVNEDGEIQDDGKNVLNSASHLLFVDEDTEEVARISLEEEFEVEGDEGDFKLVSAEWEIYS